MVVSESCLSLKMDGWVERLPTEILEKIFSYVGARDLWKCLGVCRRWRDVANSDRLWKKHCQAVYIEEAAISNLLDEIPLCSWGTAFYLYYCRPVANWKRGRWSQLELQLKSSEHIQLWSGLEGYIYYYELGRVCVYKVTEDNTIDLIEQLNVEILNQDTSHIYPSIVTNSDYLAVCNCNIIIIFKKIEGHYRYSHCLSSSLDEVFFTIDHHNFDFYIMSNFSKESMIKVKHFLGHTVWLYNHVMRSFLVFDLVKNEIKFQLDYRNLITRPKIPLLVSLHAKKVEVYDRKCEVVLTIEETCISSICFNSETLVANKLSFRAGTTARNLQSWDIRTGRELAFMPEVKASDIHLHPISSQMIVLQIENGHYSISCVCARTANVHWQLTDPCCQHTWFPELKIVMYEFVLIWPSYNDNDKYSLYELKSGTLIDEKRKVHGDGHCITDLLWVLDNRDFVIIKSFL